MTAERFYRALLRLYPRGFRDHYEEPMVEAFRHRSRRERPSVLWSHLALDLLVSLQHEWLAWARSLRRRTRLGAPMSGWLRDSRYALRGLAKRPGTAVFAASTLAVGVGTTLAIFYILNGTLLRPLPYPNAQRVVRLWSNNPAEDIERFSFTKIEFRHYAEHNEVFSSIGGDFSLDLTLTGAEGEPERLAGSFTTPGYFEVFGVEPVLGRTFTFDDVDVANPFVVVVSHHLWTRRFGADRDLLGRTIRLDGRSFTVIGILPRDFRHMDSDTDVFIPYTIGTERWIGRWLALSATLAPGFTLEQAEANLNAMTTVLAESQERTRGWSMTLEPLVASTQGPVRLATWAAFGAVVLLFALALVNVTSLFLARAAAERRLFDLRAALGAGRVERVRQTSLENALTAIAGVAFGCLLAWRATPLLLELGVDSLPRLASFSTDWRTIGFSATLCVAPIFLLALVPALFTLASRGARSRVLAGRSAAGASPRTTRILGGLVVLETALAVAILAASGLLMRSYFNLSRVDLGYEPAHAVALTISLPSTRYSEPKSILTFFDELLERVRALPGTESTSLAAYLPLGGRGALSVLNSEKRIGHGMKEPIASLQRIVSAEFFRTLHVPLLGGRSFDEPPPEGAPRQVILGAGLARQLFGDDDPIGKRVTSHEDPGPDDWREVIGVVGDVRYTGLPGAPEPQFYESWHEQTWSSMTVLTRTRAELAHFVPLVRATVHALDSEVPLFGIETLEEMTRRSVAQPRFNLIVFTVFASVALALAAAGIYGILSFVTSQRTHEIGIRIAFGACRRHVLGRVLSRALALSAVGAVVGIAAAGVSFRGLQSLLYAVSPYDPATCLSVALLLCAAVLGAGYIPALRASRVDPMTALRDE